MIKPKVLFLCSRNSCRTQMAEGLLRHLAGDRFEVWSAGAEASSLDPEAIDAMREIGVEISHQVPKDSGLLLGQRFSYVISLCDRQKEHECPIFPGAIWRLQWDIENPANAQSLAQYRRAVRVAREQIHERVFEFVQTN
jgi:arsenate reductase (thioredoxin)